jgi:hypothetical protein
MSGSIVMAAATLASVAGVLAAAAAAAAAATAAVAGVFARAGAWVVVAGLGVDATVVARLGLDATVVARLGLDATVVAWFGMDAVIVDSRGDGGHARDCRGGTGGRWRWRRRAGCVGSAVVTRFGVLAVVVPGGRRRRTAVGACRLDLGWYLHRDGLAEGGIAG